MFGSARLDAQDAPYRATTVAWWLLINAMVLVGIAFAS